MTDVTESSPCRNNEVIKLELCSVLNFSPPDPLWGTEMLTPSQSRPLGQTLLAGAGVIGFALVGAIVLYFATEGILLLWSDISGQQPHQAFTKPQ